MLDNRGRAIGCPERAREFQFSSSYDITRVTWSEMTATARPFRRKEHRVGRPLWRKVIFVTLPVLALASSLFAYWLIKHRSTLHKGMSALVQACAKERPIEPRLSGGFRAAPYSPDAISQNRTVNARLEEAVEAIGAALAEKEDPGTLMAEARLLAVQGNASKAVKPIRLALKSDPSSAEAHNDLGCCLYALGKVETALDEFESALKSDPRMAESLFNRALCYQRLQLSEPAQSAFNVAAEVERDRGWLREITERLRDVSQPLANLESRDEAEARFKETILSADHDAILDIVNKNTSLAVGRCFTLSEQYVAARASGNTSQSEEAFSELEQIGLALREVRGDPLVLDLARYLKELRQSELENEIQLERQWRGARDRASTDSFADQMPMFQQLVKKFGLVGNFVFQQRSLFNLATCLYKSNRFRESTKLLEQILQFAEGRRWYYYQELAISQMAINLSRVGEDSLAIRYCTREDDPHYTPYFEAKSLQYVGVACWHLGDLDRALENFRKSIDILISKDPRRDELAYNYLNVADIYRLKGSHHLAQLYSEAALDFAQEAQYSDLIAQSSSFSAFEMSVSGQPAIAQERMQLAFESLSKEAAGQRHFTEPLAYIRAAGIALQRNNPRESLDDYAKAQEALTWPEADITLRIEALQGHAKTLMTLGRLSEAGPELLKAVDLIDHQRGKIAEGENRSHYLDATRAVFDQMVLFDTQYQSGKQAEAFDWSERSRARTLFDEISFRNTRTGTSAASNRDLKDTAQTLSLNQVQKALPADLTLLEFAVTDQGTTIFLIDKSGMTAKPCSATAADLQRLVSEYLGLISELAPIEDILEKGKRLYDLLIEPVAADIRNKPNVCIIPDESLHFLPFGALVDGQGHYLVETHCVTYAPSASVLINCLRDDSMKPKRTPEKVVIVGNPAYDTSRFPELRSLPDSEDEANRIGTLYPGALTLVGADATVERLRSALTDSDVVHLGLHSITDEAFPGKVGLVLAKPANSSKTPQSVFNKDATSRGQGDGVWFLDAIYGVRLPHTRLVVLSSCQSGVGEYYRGEGIVSLVYPFIVAGAPSVVASLWSVQSEPTSSLMYQFHLARQSTKAGIGDALQAAQLKMLLDARYEHPFYWAAFVAVGAAQHR